MPEIIQRSFTGLYGGTYRGIRLYNEEFIRPLSFGDNWSKLRIVLLQGVNDTTDIVNAILDVGICSGTLRGIGSNNPVNYVGGGVGGGAGGRYALNRITSTTVTGGWYSASGSRHYTAQHGATVDNYQSDNVGSYYLGTAGAANGFYRRQLFIIDITRSSASCAIAVAGASSAVVQCDCNEQAVTQACEAAYGSPVAALGYSLQDGTVTALSFTYASTFTVPYTASAGPLNSLNIAWSSTSIPCLIWDIAVARY